MQNFMKTWGYTYNVLVSLHLYYTYKISRISCTCQSDI